MPVRSRRAERAGSALVFALWIALLVGVAGAAAMRLAAVGAGAARVEGDLAQARAAAEGGVWAAAHRLAVLRPGERAGRVAFALVVGTTPVAVEAIDEDGRLDLNAAPEELVAALLRATGVAEREAAMLAARVMEWRDPRGARLQGAGAGAASRPREDRFRPPFATASDLGAIPGFGPALVVTLGDQVTVHTGRPRPAEEAAPPLLRAVLTPPASAGTPPPRGGSGRRLVWRITAEARVGAVVGRVAAVVRLGVVRGLPGTVLEWRAGGS